MPALNNGTKCCCVQTLRYVSVLLLKPFQMLKSLRFGSTIWQLQYLQPYWSNHPGTHMPPTVQYRK